MSQPGPGTCCLCVPLRVGVFSIVVLQLAHGSVRLYLATQVQAEDRGLAFYFDFSAHCFSLAAAVILFLGVLFEKRNFLLPWVGLTLVTPALFLFHLSSSLLLLQLGAAAWLLLHEGAIAAVTLYLVHAVYCLYLEMAPSRVDIFDEEQTVYDVTSTVYGASTNPVFYIEEGSVASLAPRPRDSPPAYDSLVTEHKQHTANT